MFDIGHAADAIIDIAYLGFHDSLSEILEYNEDMNTVMLFNPSNFEYVSTLNNEALNMHIDASELDSILERFSARFTSITLSEDRDYLRLAGSVNEEAIAEIFNGNIRETGQYLVLKYRISPDLPNKFYYWQFYINTDGGSASNATNCYIYDSPETQVISDGEWQVLIVDLAAYGYETYAPDENGKYIAKYFRFDFFNFQCGDEVYYDIAYIGFSNNLDDIYELENDMSKVTLSTGRTESTLIDPKTGDAITAE